MSPNYPKKQVKISKIDITNDKITGRGGLNIFIKYLNQIGFFQLFTKNLGFLKGSSKGLSLTQFVKQVCAHFIDGTQMSMTGFDAKKHDPAYAAIIENHRSEMASSHQIKRFFRKFIRVGNLVFRTMLLWLFIWRLRLEKPGILILFGDSMVLDNDDSRKRQGVEATYKRKKGFQPLHIIWNGYIVDALFRSGSVHGNYNHEFATKEQLPFYQLDMNRAYYYMMVLCHFIFEAFKRDVSAELIPTSAYPDTVRRRLIDFAAKVISKGGQLILKVTAPLYEQLKLGLLWDRSMNAPPIFG